jgi:flagellar L-ring protein precursor FlgH
MKFSEKFYFVLILVLTITVWVKANITDAESLWLRGNGESRYVDIKARDVGDILTVIINESSQAAHQSVTKRAKQVDISGAPEEGEAGKKNILGFLPFIGAKGETKFSGAGATTRKGVLNAKVTVEVIEVLPNGNLMIEGRRKLRINSEEEEIYVCGIVRPEDITPQNTILSTYISDAVIKYRGEAELTNKERAGLIGRVINKIVNIFF